MIRSSSILGVLVGASLAIACGGGSGGAKATAGGGAVAAGPHVDDGRDRTTITIYRDGAIVRDLRTMTVAPGKSRIVFENVPSTLDPRSAHFVSLSDPDGTRATAMRYDSGDSGWSTVTTDLIGQPVTLGEGDRAVTGILRTVSYNGAVLETGNPEQPLILVPLDGPLRTPLSDDAVTAPRMSWDVESATGGEQQLQVAYITKGIRWDAGYNVTFDASGDNAYLQGWLSVRNDSGTAFEGADIYVVDGSMHPVLEQTQPYDPYADPYGYNDPYGYGPNVTYDQWGNPITPAPVVDEPKKKSTSTVAVRAAVNVAVPEGESHQYALIGEAGHGLKSGVELLYDPLGTDLNTKVRVPVARKEFGETTATEVSRSIEIDLGDLGINSSLPAGHMRVFQRATDGSLSPVGDAYVFGEDEDDDEGDEPKDNKLRLAIGLAPEVEAKRTQTDFLADEEEKRVVEEISITLKNNGDVDAKVVVDEHMYRGMNWVLAYQNEPGPVSKEGKQDVRWRVLVPAGEKRKVVYRVVYTW